MLKITVPAIELWDEQKEIFVDIKEQTLCLEHSLVSLSKWESKWHKPFLTKDKKTDAEMRDYVRCMTLTQNVDPMIYDYLTSDNLNSIYKYIEDPMTATVINDRRSGRGSSEQPTAELIYYWMVACNIPFECQKWHINRLMTLIRICGIKNQPPKKMSRNEILSRNAALNQSRINRLHSRG